MYIARNNNACKDSIGTTATDYLGGILAID